MQLVKLSLILIMTTFSTASAWSAGKTFSMTGQSSQSFTLARKAAESQARSICGRIVFRQTDWRYSKTARGRIYSAQARFTCGRDDLSIPDSPFTPTVPGRPFPGL